MAYLTIDKWYGGLSDGSRSGIEGSFRYGKGLNFKNDVDCVTAALALEKETGTTVSSLPKWIVYDSPQDKTYAYSDTGNIYVRSSAGVWTLLRSVANSQGQGLELYDDYLYYAQNSQVGRYGLLSGTPSFTDAWKTGLNGTTAYRPLKGFLNMLLVGNGRYLGTWDGSTWNATKLTFPPLWYVRDIKVRGDYAAIACNNNADITKATRGIIFYWDGTSSTYNFLSECPEAPINAIEANQDSVWIFAGHKGTVYLDNGRINKVKRMPFTTAGKTCYVAPGATTTLNGMVAFGLTSGTDGNVYKGIYELGQFDKNYPFALNFIYPLSTTRLQGTDKDIGAVYAVGPQIYVGWKDAAEWGIDKLSTVNNQTAITYESRILSLPKQAQIAKGKIYCEPLRTGESITINYDKDRSNSWTAFGSDNTASYTTDGAITFKILNSAFVTTDVQFQITMAGTTSHMPSVHKFVVEYEQEGIL